MSSKQTLEKEAIKSIKSFSEGNKKELLNFIEFLKLKEEEWFIDYVNSRTEQALNAKGKKQKFITLSELQITGGRRMM